MKNSIKLIVVPIAAIIVTAILSTMPPQRGQSQTAKDVIIAPAVVTMDTTSLAEDIQRVNAKAALLTSRTRIISNNSKGLLKDARRLERAVSELKAENVKMDTLMIVYPSLHTAKYKPEVIDTSNVKPAKPKRNLWQRIKGVF